MWSVTVVSKARHLRHVAEIGDRTITLHAEAQTFGCDHHTSFVRTRPAGRDCGGGQSAFAAQNQERVAQASAALPWAQPQ